MTETVQWCSLFCTGNEAIGDLNIEINDDESVAIPICSECYKVVEEDPRGAIARLLGL